jgi:hypothetical protein
MCEAITPLPQYAFMAWCSVKVHCAYLTHLYIKIEIPVKNGLVAPYISVFKWNVQRIEEDLITRNWLI